MFKLDDTTKKILEILREDPRTPNNAIATRVGIAEATVANRLRKMHDDKLIKVALRRDFRNAGYDVQSNVDCWVSGRSVKSVAEDLAKLDAVKSVVITLGKPEIVTVVHSKDRHDLASLLKNQVGAIKGISRIETHAVLSIRKSRMGYANLKAEFKY